MRQNYVDCVRHTLPLLPEQTGKSGYRPFSKRVLVPRYLVAIRLHPVHPVRRRSGGGVGLMEGEYTTVEWALVQLCGGG